MKFDLLANYVTIYTKDKIYTISKGPDDDFFSGGYSLTLHEVEEIVKYHKNFPRNNLIMFPGFLKRTFKSSYNIARKEIDDRSISERVHINIPLDILEEAFICAKLFGEIDHFAFMPIRI